MIFQHHLGRKKPQNQIMKSLLVLDRDKKENYVLAFAALNYAHGWLDAGARIGLFKVKDNRLFTVDN